MARLSRSHTRGVFATLSPGDMPDVLERPSCLGSREITRAAHCVNFGSSLCRWEVEHET